MLFFIYLEYYQNNTVFRAGFICLILTKFIFLIFIALFLINSDALHIAIQIKLKMKKWYQYFMKPLIH